jgi:hypothetical protein
LFSLCTSSTSSYPHHHLLFVWCSLSNKTRWEFYCWTFFLSSIVSRFIFASLFFFQNNNNNNLDILQPLVVFISFCYFSYAMRYNMLFACYKFVILFFLVLEYINEFFRFWINKRIKTKLWTPYYVKYFLCDSLLQMMMTTENNAWRICEKQEKLGLRELNEIINKDFNDLCYNSFCQVGTRHQTLNFFSFSQNLISLKRLNC